MDMKSGIESIWYRISWLSPLLWKVPTFSGLKVYFSIWEHLCNQVSVAQVLQTNTYTLQNEQLRLCVVILAHSSSVEHNKNN